MNWTWECTAVEADHFGHSVHVVKAACEMDVLTRTRLITLAPKLLEALENLADFRNYENLIVARKILKEVRGK